MVWITNLDVELSLKHRPFKTGLEGPGMSSTLLVGKSKSKGSAVQQPLTQ